MLFKSIGHLVSVILQRKLTLWWKWERQVNRAIWLNLRYSVFSSEACDESSLSIHPFYVDCAELNGEETAQIRHQGYGIVWDLDEMASEELAKILHDFGFDQIPMPFHETPETLMAQVQRVEGKMTLTMQIRLSGK